MSPVPEPDLVVRNLGWAIPTSNTSYTASETASSASATSTRAYQYQDSGFGATKSQILNWAAIAIVVGLMLCIAGWRLATLQDRTLKAFFLPRGLKIKWLGIDIKPPPPRPIQPTLSEIEQQRRRRRAEERFQRRRTRGDNIGEGGQRQDGARCSEDGDEVFDEHLPGYKADVSAPVYLSEWRTQAEQEGTIPAIDPETEEAIRQSGPVVDDTNPQTANDSGERVMSVAEYEARQRGDATGETIGQTTERAEDSESSYPPQSTPRQSTSDHAPAQNPILAVLRRPQPARTVSNGSIRSMPPNYDNLSRVPSRTDRTS